MKVLLIQPSFEQIYGSYRHLYKRGFLNPPLSLCYLAAALEQKGHQVILIDAEEEGTPVEELARRAREYDPGLIGYTATSVDYANCRATATHIKEALPHIPTILGGVHMNLFTRAVLAESPAFDFGCVGDGEELIVELADALEGSEGTAALTRIGGLLYRDGDRIIQNPHRPLVVDLDQYPFPNRHHLRNEHYPRSVPYRGYMTTAAFISSRGCPYACVYCAIDQLPNSKRVRYRSAANVLDELDYIVNEMGIRHVSFNDDCLTLKKSRIYELCEGIHQRGLDFTWEGLSRGDIVDAHLLKTMRQAGFVRISYGIESGDPKMLEVLQKGETLEEVERGIRLAKEAGIVTRGSVIIGSPYETRERVMATFRFLNRLKELDQANINIMQPYPGTKVREMFLNGEGGSEMLGPPGETEKLQRFGNAVIRVNDLTPETLVWLQKYGFFRFYLRPRVIWNNIRIAGWRTFASDSLGFARSLLGV